jgi:LacI family transcriptional regulator
LRRADGYRAAITAAGIEADSEMVVDGNFTAPGGATAMEQLLRNSKRPTAVFAANAASALGAAYGARRSGQVVPDDMSVVGIHDLPLGDYLEPALTTVKMPLREMGALAIDRLLGTDRDAPVKEMVKDPMEVVARSSSCRLGYRRFRSA